MKIYEGQIQYTLVKEGPSVELNDPRQVFQFMQDAFERDPLVESFWIIALNRKNRSLGRTRITVGVAHASLVHPREVYKVAIMAHASAIIAVHNHPSGIPDPSTADIRLTRKLRESSAILEIPLIDHVICGDPKEDISGNGFYSFSEAGLL